MLFGSKSTFWSLCSKLITFKKPPGRAVGLNALLSGCPVHVHSQSIAGKKVFLPLAARLWIDAGAVKSLARLLAQLLRTSNANRPPKAREMDRAYLLNVPTS